MLRFYSFSRPGFFLYPPSLPLRRASPSLCFPEEVLPVPSRAHASSRSGRVQAQEGTWATVRIIPFKALSLTLQLNGSWGQSVHTCVLG